MHLYRTELSAVVIDAVDGVERAAVLEPTWDELINHDDLAGYLRERLDAEPVAMDLERVRSVAVAPIVSQEVWAAGVTYYRSRTARMEEASDAGGSDFYDRVYEADRPELFFKATPHRVVGPGGAMRLRADSTWIVPEPELTLVVNRRGEIVGYTVGNDLSCRDIEGENPLYLPQAKTFDACAAIGPAVLVQSDPPGETTAIALMIERDGATVFEGSTTLAAMKRTPAELVGYLTREASFPQGCLLMTGTGVVPPDDFCLQAGDGVAITIEGIGTLRNTMAKGGRGA